MNRLESLNFIAYAISYLEGIFILDVNMTKFLEMSTENLDKEVKWYDYLLDN